MSNDNRKTSFSRSVPERIQEVLCDAAIVSTTTVDHIIDITPSASEVYIKSRQDEESYFDRVIFEVIRRQNYEALPRCFDDVERLVELSLHAAIDKEKDYHIQMGLLAMQAAFQCIAGAPPDIEDEILESRIVRESMAVTQFFLGGFYNLREHQRVDMANWMRGIIETAYAKGLEIQSYLASTVNAVRAGVLNEIEWLVDLPRPTFSAECMPAAVQGIAATSTVFDAIYHLPGTPFELPHLVSSSHQKNTRPKRYAPEITGTFTFIFK